MTPLNINARRNFALFALSAVLVAGGCSSPAPRLAEIVGGQKQTADGKYYLDDGPPEGVTVAFADIPDAVPRAETINPIHNRPYTALGLNFTPDTELRPYSAQGKASWYGKRYHGRKTSTGEVYDMYQMTAAHPTLVIPSYVRVTRVDTGKSVVVRVNDRGPFLGGRIIDLSYAAAGRLGYIKDGTAEVLVESILPQEAAAAQAAQQQNANTINNTAAETKTAPDSSAPVSAPVAAAAPPPKPVPAPETQTNNLAALPQPQTQTTTPKQRQLAFFVQLGAFGQASNAEQMRDKISSFALQLPIVIHQSDGLHRVVIGPYQTRAQAERAKRQLADAGFDGGYVKEMRQ